MMRVFWLGFFIWGFPWLTSAQSADFTISSTIIAADAIPPTIPGGVNAVPISDAQIDLSWNASTDNVAVTGYQVWRDGLQIATSTLLTYSDIALSSSTLYSYYIQAFDAAGNISASSTVAATSTLATVIIPPDPPEDAGNGNQATRILAPAIEILEWNTSVAVNTATLSFDTNVFTTATVEWNIFGIEQSVATINALRKTHSFTFTDLDPATTYEGVLRLRDRFGREYLTRQFSITTDSGSDTIAPSNITNFEAVADEDIIKLTWDPPTALDFARIRIVRSDQFYPVDAADGRVVYEGVGTSATDEAVVADVTYYYSIFVYDLSGNYSSGAIAKATIRRSSDGSLTPILEPVDELEDIGTGDLTGVPVHVRQHTLRQNLFGTTTPNITQLDRTTVSLPYEAVPLHLKTIVVTFTDSENADLSYSYLMRANADFSSYEATISPFTNAGMYQVVVSMYDFKTNTHSTLSGPLLVIAPVYMIETAGPVSIWWNVLLLLMLLMYIRWQYRYIRATFHSPV